LWWFLRGLTIKLTHRIEGLRKDVATLPLARIENMKQVQVIIGDRGGPEMKLALEQMAEDSKVKFQGIWVPEPRERLAWPAMLGQNSEWLLRPSTISIPLLAGILVSFLAFILAIAIDSESIGNEWMRLLGLLPLLLGAISFGALYQSKHYEQARVQTAWDSLIVQLDRRLPVYNQAAETAALLKGFVAYDQEMTRSIKLMTEQVELLASGHLTESITGAVRQVMVTTLTPPIQKSTDALAALANQLEKRLTAGETQLMRLYTDLSGRQQQQSELWIKRYQEMTQILTGQQKQMLQQIAAGSQESWQTLRQQLIDLIQSWKQGQEALQQSLLGDQQQSLTAIRDESQSVLTQLREQYTTTLQEQSTNQTTALADIREQVQGSVERISQAVEQTLAQICDNHGILLGALDQHQQEAMAALSAQQEQTLLSLTEHQQNSLQLLTEHQSSSLQILTEHQSSSLQAISDHQVEGLQTMNSQQQDALETISAQQQSSLETISAQQQSSLQTISAQQQRALDGFLLQQVSALDTFRRHQQESQQQQTEKLEHGLQRIDQGQQSALDIFRQTQAEAVANLAKQQSQGVRDLLESFTGQVADVLTVQLGPVSVRLQDSAQALIGAQSYARDVQQTLALQKEQARVLEESIRDVLAQLVETRKAMSGDLGSLEKSTRVMSESAASMSAIYAGSQAGLTDAIANMSANMLDLSDSMQAVLRGSGEQTKQMQIQANETYEINQRQLEAVRGQIDILTNDLATRIDQLMIGFSQLTADLIKNVQSTVNNQNDQLGSGLKVLTEVMADEARSISLYAQQINMDINQLNSTLGQSVVDFAKGIQTELTQAISSFDQETADILRRLAIAAAELGDAVEILPDVLRNKGLSSGKE
jgi:hypothetical protein